MKKKYEIVPILIIGTFVSFACFIGYMVYQSFQLDVNLVQEDYYAAELKYQDEIDANRKGKAIAFVFTPNDNTLTLQLPTGFEAKKVKGEIRFYRPSDVTLDFKVPLQLNEKNNQQKLSTEKLTKGFWKVKFLFEYEGENYSKEIKITI